MASNFNKTLDKIRAKSSNTVEQGTAFEKLSKIYFENDDIQKQEFNRIWHLFGVLVVHTSSHYLALPHTSYVDYLTLIKNKLLKDSSI